MAASPKRPEKEPERDECDEALRQILTVPVPDRPRSENREPTKKELSTRYKLTRRK